VRAILKKVPDEVKAKYYGCGSPFPLGIDGLRSACGLDGGRATTPSSCRRPAEAGGQAAAALHGVCRA
jgi:hypothetical protein